MSKETKNIEFKKLLKAFYKQVYEMNDIRLDIINYRYKIAIDFMRKKGMLKDYENYYVKKHTKE